MVRLRAAVAPDAMRREVEIELTKNLLARVDPQRAAIEVFEVCSRLATFELDMDARAEMHAAIGLGRDYLEHLRHGGATFAAGAESARLYNAIQARSHQSHVGPTAVVVTRLIWYAVSEMDEGTIAEAWVDAALEIAAHNPLVVEMLREMLDSALKSRR